MKKELYLYLFIYITAISCSDSVKVTVSSPDGKNDLTLISRDEQGNRGWPAFTIDVAGKKVLLPSYLQLNTGTFFRKEGFDVIKIEYESVNDKWVNNFGERKEIPDNYNQAKFFLSSNELNFNFICRVYNEGIAFAYEFPEQYAKDSLVITDEEIIYRFPADYLAWSAPAAQAAYKRLPLTQIVKGCERPLVIEVDSSLTIALAEAKLVDYARMKFEPDTVYGIAIRSRLDGFVQQETAISVTLEGDNDRI